jgi:hypothetical protein
LQLLLRTLAWSRAPERPTEGQVGAYRDKVASVLSGDVSAPAVSMLVVIPTMLDEMQRRLLSVGKGDVTETDAGSVQMSVAWDWRRIVGAVREWMYRPRKAVVCEDKPKKAAHIVVPCASSDLKECWCVWQLLGMIRSSWYDFLVQDFHFLDEKQQWMCMGWIQRESRSPAIYEAHGVVWEDRCERCDMRLSLKSRVFHECFLTEERGGCFVESVGGMSGTRELEAMLSRLPKTVVKSLPSPLRRWRQIAQHRHARMSIIEEGLLSQALFLIGQTLPGTLLLQGHALLGWGGVPGQPSMGLTQWVTMAGSIGGLKSQLLKANRLDVTWSGVCV